MLASDFPLLASGWESDRLESRDRAPARRTF